MDCLRFLFLLTSQAESSDNFFLRALIPTARTRIARIQIPATRSSRIAEKPNTRAFLGSGEINNVTSPETDNSRNTNKESKNRNCGSLAGASLGFMTFSLLLSFVHQGFAGQKRWHLRRSSQSTCQMEAR